MDIAVLGAGTAGLACAVALNRQGYKVTVFERHPSLAPVGAGMLIQPSGLRALTQLGVHQRFNEVSTPVERLHGQSHRGWTLVDVPYGDTPARGVSRPAMSDVLFQCALQLGVVFRFGAAVTDVRQVADQVEVEAGQGSQCFDLVVVAAGSGSALAQQCGLSASAQPYRWGALNAMFGVEVDDWPQHKTLLQRFHGPRKLMGLLPTALAGGRLTLSFFWSLPVAQLPWWRSGAMQDWVGEMRALWPESEPVLAQFQSHDQFSFATYRHAWPKTLSKGRVCMVGDAAHAMSPQLGLGSTLAMGDALSLAKQLAGEGQIETALLRYERDRLALVRRYQFLSRALTPCFQADSPAWWRDLAFGLGCKLPGAKSMMKLSLKG